jgi:hypothetical protein
VRLAETGCQAQQRVPPNRKIDPFDDDDDDDDISIPIINCARMVDLMMKLSLTIK